MEEAGSVAMSTTTVRVGTTITARLTDPDGGVTNTSWQWQRRPSGGSWSNLSGATTSTYAASSADQGSQLRATVSYDDAHGTGKSATSAQQVAVLLALPTVTITRQDATVTEGQDVQFTLTADPGPVADITVRVSVTEVPLDSFLADPLPAVKDIVITAGATIAQLSFQTTVDSVDEANGTTTATVLSGTGYSVGSPSSASVVVEDDDRPLTPTGLRANGHLVGGKVTIRWNPAPGATGYNVRYAEEVCVPDDPHERFEDGDGTCGLGDPPMWNTIAAENVTTQELTIDGVTVLETRLEFTPQEPLRSHFYYNTLDTMPFNEPDAVPWPLYHVEVQAVIVDGSDWSDFALVFPTTEPPMALVTRIASNWFKNRYQPERNGSHEYAYTLCKDTITTDVAWNWARDKQGHIDRNPVDVAAIATAIEAAIEEWETGVRWVSTSTNTNIVSATATEREPCTDSDSNPVKFMPDDFVEEECKAEHALGCVLLGTSDVLLTNIPLKYIASTNRLVPTRWDLPANGCSLLHVVVMHEAGHVFGFSPIHSRLPNTVMYESIFGSAGPYCSPQKHDVVGMMANYQSR